MPEANSLEHNYQQRIDFIVFHIHFTTDHRTCYHFNDKTNVKVACKMSDSSIIEDMERYRRNNIELAIALNDLKSELNMVQMQMLEQKHELQNVYTENAILKANLAQKDTQLNTWRAVIVDLVTTNTKKYTEMMQKIGLVPAANGTANGTANSTMTTEKESTSNAATFREQSNNRINLQRCQRLKNDYSPTRLPDLTEESIQSNTSKCGTPSPEKKFNHITSRRRASVPPMTPASPLRAIQECSIGPSDETKAKRSSARMKKMEKICDENAPTNATTNGSSGGRSKRSAAPKNLSEPKLGTKLRRN